jgi:hypothetical protein
MSRVADCMAGVNISPQTQGLFPLDLRILPKKYNLKNHYIDALLLI